MVNTPSVSPAQPPRYLAFEGGGGRGTAFIGAIEALEACEPPIIGYTNPGNDLTRRIDPSTLKGIAGTSAGAIMATLLAAGYDSRALKKILLSGLTNEAFDDVSLGQSPTVVFDQNPGYFGGQRRQNSFTPVATFDNEELLGGGRSRQSFFSRFLELTLTGLTADVTEFWAVYRSLTGQQPLPGVLQKVLSAENIADYCDSLLWDLGLFCADAIPKIIETALQLKFNVANLTFDQLYSQSRLHLKIAGSCVSTHEPVWFDHIGPWANMPIATAVRISMSIPFVFKPVAVVTQVKGSTVDLNEALLFVDGGLTVNLPLHAFDAPGGDSPVTRAWATLSNSIGRRSTLSGATIPASPRNVYSLNRQVLALRLTAPEEARAHLTSGLFDYAGLILDTALAAGESGQIRTADEAAQTLDLDTSGLSVFDFSPPLATVERSRAASAVLTRSYLEQRGFAF